MDMSIRFPNLDINLGHIAKSLSFFGYEITVYGMLMAAGMLLGLLVVLTQARRQNQNTNLYLEVVILSILGGVIGARAYYVAFSWELFQDQGLNVFFDLRSGGLAIYGGIFGGMLVAFVFCCIRRVSFGRIADIACTGLLTGQSIGIWGNFFNRASFGKYTDSLLAMQLPLNAVSSGEVTKTIREQIVNVNGTDYIQVHPLFFYESIWCLLLLVFLLIYNRRKSFQGELFLRYLAGYGLGKAVIEWLRTDPLYIPNTKISVSLTVSVALFLICEIMAAVRHRLARKRQILMKQQKEARCLAGEKIKQSK